MGDLVRRLMTQAGTLTARPGAVGIVFVYTVVWLVVDRNSLDFHAVATLATWFMTLLIQRSEHRDTQAIHAKLDELLRADNRASSTLAQIDEEEPEDIEAHRADQRQRTDTSENGVK